MSHLTRRSLLASALTVTTIPDGASLVSAQATPVATAVAQAPVIPDAETLHRRLSSLFPSLNVPGLLVLVQHPSIGIWKGAFGVSDLVTGDPITTDMHFRIGSNTKTFTATAALRLIDQGKFSLENTIAELHPDLAFVPNADRITIKMLLGMRSGLPSHENTVEYYEMVVRDPHKHFSGMEQAELLRGKQPDFEPDAENDYSNTNYLILALILEKITGKPYADVIEQEVLNPLSLSHTSAPLDSSLPNPHPHGYRWPTPEEDDFLDGWGTPASVATPVTPNGGMDVTHYSASTMFGSTNMVSTLDDLNVFINAVVDGTILSPEMHAEQLTALPEGSDEYPGPEAYGLGIVKMPKFWGHNGMVAGFHSLTLCNREWDLSIVMVANAFATGDNSVVYDATINAITGTST